MVKIEFIESYIKHDGDDYEWSDNHGELIRCKNCKYSHTMDFTDTPSNVIKRFCRKWRDAQTGSYTVQDDDYCSYAEKK